MSLCLLPLETVHSGDFADVNMDVVFFHDRCPKALSKAFPKVTPRFLYGRPFQSIHLVISYLYYDTNVSLSEPQPTLVFRAVFSRNAAPLLRVSV